MPYLGNIPATQFAELKYQDFTGGSGTSFTLNDPVGSAQELEVFVNNVRQEPGVAYTVSGTGLTMTGSIASTDDFYVVFQGKSTGTATHPAGQALTATDGTFTGNTSVTGNATVTGDLTVDTNTLVVDATNNNVGVNTAAVAANLEVGTSASKINALTVKTATGSGGVAGISFMAGQTTAGREKAAMFFKETNGGAHYTGDLVFAIATSSGSAAQVAASDEVCRITSNGLTFNGDTAAANALDDYEEGTFTPAPTVGTVTLADAAYTKVGRKVTVHFNAYNFSDRSSTSHIEFTNLPYTADSSIGSTANSGMHRYINAGDSLAFYIPRNQSKIQLFSLNSGSGWTPTQYSHLNSTSAEMYVHLTYFTAT